MADVGLTAAHCDYLVNTTEQACRGTYAAYTYAKQTLGCREYPVLAEASFDPVHTIVHGITSRFEHDPSQVPSDDSCDVSGAKSNNNNSGKSSNNKKHKDKDKGGQIAAGAAPGATDSKQNVNHRILQLDDREPHIVKYDVTKKERQKLDMHTDKSEWTFLIALSNGCGVDYEGGGTYFECIDATVHIQRGHALVFPGKLRHCGQKITSGLRFLLVGFLVDKSSTLLLSSAAGNNKNGSANNIAPGVDKGAKGTSTNVDAQADGSTGATNPGMITSTTKAGNVKAAVAVSHLKD